MCQYTLVMSCCVNPNGMGGLSEQGIMDRIGQYASAVRFYANEPSVKSVLFVDNSGSNLEQVKERADCDLSKVRFLSFAGNDFPREWGKGYGEFLLLDRAFEYLQKARCAKSDFGMLKVTGRYPILNIKDMIHEFESTESEFQCDIIDHGIYDFLMPKGKAWNGHGARSIIWAATSQFYKKYLYGKKELLKTGWGAERLIYETYLALKGTDCACRWRFKTEPRLSGFAGHVKQTWLHSVNYDGIVNRSKRVIRQVCRRLAPALWV